MADNDLSPIDRLRTPPDDVPDAIERIARVKALTGWLGDMEEPVRDWLKAKAAEVEAMTGSSFRTAAADVGTANLSNPQPTPRIVDPEAFARWYVADVLEGDPDEEHDGSYTVQFDKRVTRQIVATVEPAALLAFLDAHADAGRSHPDDPMLHNARYRHVADALAEQIVVDEQWWIGEDTLEDMISGDLHPYNGKPRAKLVKDALRVIDTAAGDDVPGVRVAAPGKRVLTVTPDKELKKALREELEAIIGPPALAETSDT